jgi:hypothetical protein
MNTAATKPRLIEIPAPTWMPRIADSGDAVDDRTHDDAHGAARSLGAEALLDNWSATRKTATPTSIHRPVCHGPMWACASGSRSKETAAIIAPAPNPPRIPTTLVGTVTQQTSRPARSSDDCASNPQSNASSMSNDLPRQGPTPSCPATYGLVAGWVGGRPGIAPKGSIGDARRGSCPALQAGLDRADHHV